jgi:GTP1/Obg family GTP-binding protein
MIERIDLELAWMQLTETQTDTVNKVRSIINQLQDITPDEKALMIAGFTISIFIEH